jgi:hypothetical protein
VRRDPNQDILLSAFLSATRQKWSRERESNPRPHDYKSNPEATTRAITNKNQHYFESGDTSQRIPSADSPVSTAVSDADAITLLLRNGGHTIVSPQDYDLASRFRWSGRQSSKSWKVYARTDIVVDGKRANISLHRFLMNAGPGEVVDHINGDSLDNRRCNLRLCSNAQNTRNQRVHASRKTTSAYKGVYRQKSGLFRAQIMCQYRKVNLGSFGCELTAARVYDEAARRLHGEFARLNFPNERMTFESVTGPHIAQSRNNE